MHRLLGQLPQDLELEVNERLNLERLLLPLLGCFPVFELSNHHDLTAVGAVDLLFTTTACGMPMLLLLLGCLPPLS